MKTCRECEQEFKPSHPNQAICSVNCRRARANRKTARWAAENKEHVRDRRREYEATYKDRRNELHRQYRQERPEYYRQKSRQQHRRHMTKERQQYALWQQEHRAERSLYMRDWTRRNLAIQQAKEDPRLEGAFVLVRTKPAPGEASFWRGISRDQKIARAEEVVARYLWEVGAWRVYTPTIRTPEIDRLVTTLQQRERAGKKVPTS